MKKRIWKLAGAGVTAVIAAAFLCGILQENESAAPQQSYEAEQILVLKEKRTEELESVRVVSEEGEFCANKNQQGDMELPGLKGLPSDSEKLRELSKYACLIRGQQVRKDAQGCLKEYGLEEKSSVRVEIAYADGEEAVFWIGAKAEGRTADSRYVLYENVVYLMFELHLAPFLNQIEYYISRQLTPSNQEAEYILLYLSLERPDLEKPLSVIYSGMEETTDGRNMAAYEIASPKEAAITYNEQGRKYLQSVFGIEAEPEKAHPSLEETASYGLDKPELVIKAAYMNRQGEDFGIRLAVSAKNETGEAYLLADGLDVIYKYDPAEAPWYEITLEDILGRQICMPDIRTVSCVAIETEGQNLSVNLTWNEQNELEAGQNGKTVSGEEFKKLYQILISAEIDELCNDITEEEAGSRVMKITYEYKDAGEDTITFYKGPSRQMYVFANGEAYGLIRTTYVDVMQKAVLDFSMGKELVVRY